jgi:acetyltransferase-like isoleucine patch superfamily enzyme
MQSSEVTEKHKMLIGEPYKAHIDGELLDDRRSCMAAVERWNQAHQHSRATSDEEKGRLFKAILDPSQRPDPNYQYRETSASLTCPGTIGSRVIIVSPFTCDYGYNIHIGDDSFLGANCTIEDAGDISIGSRVHIGKNVIFCGTDEPILREGSQSELTAGAITIEDEVNIGAGTIIMPHRTIGKGASIAAGSVVTRVRQSISSQKKSVADFFQP